MLGPIIVTTIRLLVPFSMLRWPLGGLIASFMADTLDVVLLNPFVPMAGDEFEIISFASRSGEFTTVNGAGFLNNQTFLLPLYGATDVTLRGFIPGDGNLLGSVGPEDYTIWADGFGMADPDFTEFLELLRRALPELRAREEVETPELTLVLEELSRLRYEVGRRERLVQEVDEGAAREEAQAIARLEAEVRRLVREPEKPAGQLERLRDLGYGDER